MDEAQSFMQGLCKRLRLPERFALPAYEDALYYLWQEGNLPDQFDPLEHDLKLDAERKRVLAQLDRGLNEPVGFVLPLSWDWHQQGWHSCTWSFRRGHLHLVPGDSAIGMRLPLEVVRRVRETVGEAPRQILGDGKLVAERLLLDARRHVARRLQRRPVLGRGGRRLRLSGRGACVAAGRILEPARARWGLDGCLATRSRLCQSAASIPDAVSGAHAFPPRVCMHGRTYLRRTLLL